LSIAPERRGWRDSVDGSTAVSPDSAPIRANESCPVCGSDRVAEIRCKVICQNCRTILQSCADLGA